MDREKDFKKIDSMLNHFQKFRKLKKGQIETSSHDISSIIELLPFNLEVVKKSEYTWAELKEYINLDGYSVLICLPSHLALVFGTGEDKLTGKFRHVLVGRPSGGQSPSGWIPYTSKDIYFNETLWRDEINLTGGLSYDTNCGLSMFINADSTSQLRRMFICQRDIYVLKTETIQLEKSYDIHTKEANLDFDLFKRLLIGSGGIEKCKKCIGFENYSSFCKEFIS